MAEEIDTSPINCMPNKLGLTSATDLVREEERISKKKAKELFEQNLLGALEPGKFTTPHYLITNKMLIKSVQLIVLTHTHIGIRLAV